MNIWEWFRSLPVESQVKLLAVIGASVAFTVSLVQYRTAQRWRRLEWVAKEMDTFLADSSVTKALQMIDWGRRRIELHPEADSADGRFVTVDDDGVAAALERHELRRAGFSRDEAAIRDIFDHLLDRIERFQSFVEAKLVTVDDIRPYLRYWAEHIIDARSNDSTKDRIVQLRRFIVAYDYEGVPKLLARIARRPWPTDREKPEPYTCRIGVVPTMDSGDAEVVTEMK